MRLKKALKSKTLPEIIDLAEQLRAMYVESVGATTEILNPAVLRKLDTAIAEAKNAMEK